jgi:hypothetical protein
MSAAAPANGAPAPGKSAPAPGKSARGICKKPRAAQDLCGEVARTLPGALDPAAAASAPLRQAVVSPQKMARLRRQQKAPRGRFRDALFHPKRQAQRRAAGAGPNEAVVDAAGVRSAGPAATKNAAACNGARSGSCTGTRAARRGSPRRRAVPVQLCPVPRMRPLVVAKRLVREGAEDYRAHPSRLMPGHYEEYWAPDKVSR